MGYIEEIRALIRQRPFVMVGAGTIIIDSHGWLLLGWRTDNNTWGIPGGALEPGETLDETARRETQEETGLEVASLALFGAFSGPELQYTNPSGDQVHNVSIFFESQEVKGQLEANSEHRVFQFFDPIHLPEPLSPPILPVNSRWLEQRKAAPG